MSNLIKSVYFQMDQDDTRVINSDDHVVQFAPELLQQVEASSVNDPEETEPVGEFQQGMNVLNMEDVREEERARVQEETSLEMESMLADARAQAEEILQNARELWHRYVLGVYDLMDRLTTDYPHILLENCSGGGARFDPGMLYYSPQIWCSDDTDAIERLKIQHGTSMCYPCSAMGAHVSDCPNHTVGRNTPFKTRGHVAMVGTFGYELDVTRIPQEDRDAIPAQIEEFNKFNKLVRTGDHYRIGNMFEDNTWDAWEFVAKDKSEALFEFVQVLGRPNERSRRIKLKGLEADAYYYEENEPDKKISGAALMNAGINIAKMWNGDGLYGDFCSKILHFIKA